MASARQTLCPWLVMEGFQTEQREHLALTREKLRQYTSASSTVCEGVFWHKTGATYKNTKAVRKYHLSSGSESCFGSEPCF